MYQETQAHKDLLISHNPQKKDGKYTQLKRGIVGGVDRERHEYVTPSGEVGYSLILRAEKDGKEYMKVAGAGPESNSRNFDWRELNLD